ncbi:MAG: hypothetical protein QF872_07595, partial [Gammaproteobacteria bacterium]|nr:hypothetical protein [Gammaproteobacteria bacterium]
MAKKLSITRRDFMNGFAMSLTAGTALSPIELLAMNQQISSSSLYPPELTGLRGSHPGSFEVAHALAMNGASWTDPSDQTDRDYDVVIIGGGIALGHPMGATGTIMLSSLIDEMERIDVSNGIV